MYRGETVCEGIKPSLLLGMQNLPEKRDIDFHSNPSIAEIDEIDDEIAQRLSYVQTNLSC